MVDGCTSPTLAELSIEHEEVSRLTGTELLVNLRGFFDQPQVLVRQLLTAIVLELIAVQLFVTV